MGLAPLIRLISGPSGSFASFLPALSRFLFVSESALLNSASERSIASSEGESDVLTTYRPVSAPRGIGALLTVVKSQSFTSSVAQTSCGDRGAWLLLAPTPALRILHQTCVQHELLEDEVRRHCEAGQAKSRGPAETRLEGGCRLGVFGQGRGRGDRRREDCCLASVRPLIPGVFEPQCQG